MSDELPFPPPGMRFDITASTSDLSAFLEEEVFSQKAPETSNADDDNDNDNAADNDAEGVNRLTHQEEPPSYWEQNKGLLPKGISLLQTMFRQQNQKADNDKDNDDKDHDNDDDKKKDETKVTSIVDVAMELIVEKKKQQQQQQSKSANNNTKNEDMQLFWKLLEDTKEQWTTVAENSKINLSTANPLAFLYYIGVSESKYTPSYKRREHRFYPSLITAGDNDKKKVSETMFDLHDALYLATVSYLPSVKDITEALEECHGAPWAMVYCDITSKPKEPGHFICVKREQQVIIDDKNTNGSSQKKKFRFPWQAEEVLDVLMVVRGTKEMADVLSDALIDTVPYHYNDNDNDKGSNSNDDDDKGNDNSNNNNDEDERSGGGLAHGGILEAGRFLVQKHSEFLETLRKESKRDKIRLTLIGHSLGAGAAAIACMEFNNNNNNESSKIEAKAIGFGCPPILSKELSESAKEYVTTVVCDSDVVPRMSGATISNLVMDVLSTPYTDLAMIDVRQILEAIEDNIPKTIFFKPPDEEQKKSLMETVKKGLDESFEINRIDKKKKKKDNKEKEEDNKEKSADDSTDRANDNDDDDDDASSVVAVEPLEVVLFPPGKCIHLYRDGAGISGAYVPCTFFNEIEISRTMMLDHMTAVGYDRVFHEMMRGYLNEIRFTFRHDVEKVSKKS